MAYASQELKAALAEAQRVVDELLRDLKVEAPDKNELKHGLKQVNDQLKVLDIHLGPHHDDRK